MSAFLSVGWRSQLGIVKKKKKNRNIFVSQDEGKKCCNSNLDHVSVWPDPKFNLLAPEFGI